MSRRSNRLRHAHGPTAAKLCQTLLSRRITYDDFDELLSITEAAPCAQREGAPKRPDDPSGRSAEHKPGHEIGAYALVMIASGALVRARRRRRLRRQVTEGGVRSRRRSQAQSARRTHQRRMRDDLSDNGSISSTSIAPITRPSSMPRGTRLMTAATAPAK